MLSASQLLRLKQAAHDALLCEAATRVPAELTISQWALESGWGAHQPGNNCFGIKTYPGCFASQTLETKEFQNGVNATVRQDFAAFPSLNTCFQKHADLISSGKPYASVWTAFVQTKNVEGLVRGIAPIYATARDYAEQLLSVMAMPQVKTAIEEFKVSMKPIS